MPPIMLPAGAGLDRDTGAPSESPDSYADLRNVVHYQNSVRLRGGLGASVETVTGESYVCHITVFKAAGKVIYVTYDSATGDVNVYEADLQGQNPSLVGAWGTLTGAAVPPQFTSAESFGILVLAHDEPDVTARLATYRYDPAAGTPWDDITADLDGLGAQPVKFRGVYQWLGYVFGWGFFSNTDPDRPEVVRSSSPDDPTVYNANHYFRIGERTSPVIGLQAVGSSLGVWKASSWYRIDGDSRTNWSVQLIDPYVGLVSARAVLNVEGVAHWWSPQGPRMTTGGVTEDAGLVLDLTGNAPADLPTPGAPERIYTLYFPDIRHLVYHSPADSGQMLAWRANLRNPSEPTWAWWTFPRAFLHAAQVNADDVVVIEPGTASAVTASGSSGSGTASITVGWTHNNVVGDETIELWYETPGGVWSKLKEFSYGSVAGPTGTTTFTGGALVSGTGQVALRYRRAGRYATGYESSNPDDWPAAAKASVTIVVVNTPTGITAVYTPGTQTLAINWTIATAGADTEIELLLLRPVAGPIGVYISAILTQTITVANPTATWSGTSTPSPNLLQTARGQGDGLRVRLRSVLGGVPSAWSTPINVFIGLSEKPTITSWALTTASVSLGTIATCAYTNTASIGSASAYTTELVASVQPNSPPNSGGAGSLFEVSTSVVGGVSPIAVGWDSFTGGPNGCQLVGQQITLATAKLRQQLTIAGVTHWTWPDLETNAAPFVCGV